VIQSVGPPEWPQMCGRFRRVGPVCLTFDCDFVGFSLISLGHARATDCSTPSPFTPRAAILGAGGTDIAGKDRAGLASACPATPSCRRGLASAPYDRHMAQSLEWLVVMTRNVTSLSCVAPCSISIPSGNHTKPPGPMNPRGFLEFHPARACHANNSDNASDY
jgi:hypothetical protein